MITVVWLCGTGFADTVDGISQVFADCLDPTRFEFQPVPYPADYGTRLSYAESVARGRFALASAIRNAPGRVVAGGYSQGAGIAGDVVAEIGRGERPGLEVDACALIADPRRPRLTGMPDTAPAPGYGVSDERPVEGIPTYWAAAPGDPISALPAGNPLRTVADVSEYFTIASPADAVKWGEDLVAGAKACRWQRWWSLENWRDWGGAIEYAWNYLQPPVGGGRHTAAYIELGIAARLAATINRTVR
ncbi:PE-PPE domain-containing protein [Nocardia sp. BSTN01]|uniref:PE-PPE domain-containing protein n=1 Tax=Nocardia sp. BSTN01 TaxID=2783665 RepID=UPI00188F3978|nr:PE-PPE domain-containing protein [Nocardia sp. BSTN01]MBF5002376.1 PE-PPE domain-containing protein [Nocardia sp. BSTN01]